MALPWLLGEASAHQVSCIAGEDGCECLTMRLSLDAITRKPPLKRSTVELAFLCLVLKQRVPVFEIMPVSLLLEFCRNVLLSTASRVDTRTATSFMLHQYQPNQIIYKQDDPSAELFFLLGGEVAFAQGEIRPGEVLSTKEQRDILPRNIMQDLQDRLTPPEGETATIGRDALLCPAASRESTCIASSSDAAGAWCLVTKLSIIDTLQKRPSSRSPFELAFLMHAMKQSTPFGESLTGEILLELCRGATVRRYKRGQIVSLEGAHEETFYWILSGSGTVARGLEDFQGRGVGDTVSFPLPGMLTGSPSVVQQGEGFGEETLLSFNNTSRATVVAGDLCSDEGMVAMVTTLSLQAMLSKPLQLRQEYESQYIMDVIRRDMRNVVEGFDTERVRHLARVLKIVTFREGQVIMKQGNVGNKYFYIYDGSVQVVHGQLGALEALHGVPEGGMIPLHSLPIPGTIATVQNGSGFGEIALVSSDIRTATVIAGAGCVCLQIDREAYLQGLISVVRFPAFVDLMLGTHLNTSSTITLNIATDSHRKSLYGHSTKTMVDRSVKQNKQAKEQTKRLNTVHMISHYKWLKPWGETYPDLHPIIARRGMPDNAEKQVLTTVIGDGWQAHGVKTGVRLSTGQGSARRQPSRVVVL